MDILFSMEEASVNDVHDRLPQPPAHTAIRTMLRILTEKGLVKRHKQGREFFYSPRLKHEHAGRSAMERVVQTFFGGSLENALGAYFSSRKAKLDDATFERLQGLIEQARRQGR